MEQNRTAYLFYRYVNKSASLEEIEEFKAILKKDGKNEDLEKILDDHWSKTTEAEVPKDRSDEILFKVFSSNEKSKNIQHIRFIKPWLGWAAAILICGISVLFITKSSRIFKPNANLATTHLNHSTIPAAGYITVKTSNEHHKVILADGSIVVLNVNSSVTYSRVFNKNKREIFLNGEGYFDIKHDDKKPFIVYTGEIKTVVLGTAFNISAYGAEKDIKITVTRGKVSVANKHSILGVLTPNKQITFNKDKANSTITQVISKNSIQWQENDLYFDDVSMAQAALILSKRFNMPITFTNDQAKNCRFTATFLKGESIDEILKVVCSYNNAQYHLYNNGIIINGQGCE